MKKNMSYILIITFMVVLSTGIFVGIALPSDRVLGSSHVINSFFAAEYIDSMNFGQYLYSYIKEDIFLIIIVLFFSGAVITLPLTFFAIYMKIFSLGYATTFLLVHFNGSHKLPIIFATLFPRCLFKLPVYLFLLIISISMARIIVRSVNNRTTFSFKEIKKYVTKYLLCFGILIVSSFLEVLLLIIIL